MRFCVLISALLLPAASAWAGENLTPEVLLPGYEAADAYRPAAAFGKDVFLVVWQAGRNETADLVGARVGKDGRALDAKPFVISKAKDCQARPRVAFGGGNFLVVWHDLRNGKDYDVYAARVSPDGKVLDPDGLLVAGGEYNQCEPAVCFDGAAFQVLWRNFYGKGYHIYGGRVSPDGRALDDSGALVAKPPSKVPFHMGTRTMGTPGLLAGKGGLILAGARASSLHVWRMKDGKMTGEMVSVPGKWSAEPGFASDGKNVLVVYSIYMNQGGRSTGERNTGMVLLKGEGDLAAGTVKGAKVTPKPKCLSATPIIDGRKQVRHPVVAWDGVSYVAAWDIVLGRRSKKPVHDAVLLRRVSAAGEPQGQDTPVAGDFASPAYRPAIATDGAGATLIAYERHPKTGDVPIKIAFRILKK